MFVAFVRAARLAALITFSSYVLACGSSGPSEDSLRADLDRASTMTATTRAEDDRTLSGNELTRSDFVRAVLDRNPTIDEAREGWRAAVAHVRESGSLADPMVTLGAAPLSIGSSSARFGYDVGISQTIPWPGKLGFEESAAKADALAAQNDFETTRRDLSLTAALLYDEYFVSVRSLEVNEEHVALMKQLKAAALAALEAGRGSTQDPLQAEAELTHMEHDRVELESDRDVAMAEMNELLHRPADAPLPPPVRELDLPDAPKSEPLDRLEDDATAHRSEIAAARLRAQAEDERSKGAARASYPDLTISTSYDSMWDMPEHRWMVGLGFNLPIQLSKRAGEVDEANAARARYEAEAAAASDKARTEVVVAQKRLDEAGHVVRLFDERLLPVARDQVDAARAGFIASRNDFAAVISAEKNLRSVELDDQIARATLDRRHAELDRARGMIAGVSEKGASR